MQLYVNFYIKDALKAFFSYRIWRFRLLIIEKVRNYTIHIASSQKHKVIYTLLNGLKNYFTCSSIYARIWFYFLPIKCLAFSSLPLGRESRLQGFGGTSVAHITHLSWRVLKRFWNQGVKFSKECTWWELYKYMFYRCIKKLRCRRKSALYTYIFAMFDGKL